jgi:ATP-dependent Clp protease ATP-binding subunit ClpC
MRVTERAQHAVRYAKQEAGRLGHDRVGTEHLLLALLRDQECLAVATLAELGIPPETVRRRVEETVDRGPDGETVGPGQGEPGMGFHLPTISGADL